MIRRTAVIFAALVVALTGCRSGRPGGGGLGAQTGWPGALPGYEEVAKAYNARVEPLTRLSAAVLLRLSYPDEQNTQHLEQVEGHCYFVRPRQVFLRLTKVGQTIAMLGSDQDKFWWIELGDRKRAVIGEHDQVGTEQLATAGVPVHPLDLIELLGITPLPAGAEAGQVTKSPEGGALIVTVPSRFGSRRIVLPNRDYQPSRIELLAANGEVAASAELSKYKVVSISGAGPGVVHPFVATDAVIMVAGGATEGHLELSAPTVDPAVPRASAFDLNHWLEIERVDEIVHLDKPPASSIPHPASGEHR